MESLVTSIALKYAKSKGIDYISKEAEEYAKKLLGIDKQQGNPKYAISLGGNTFDIGNMAKRGLLNRGIDAITSGSSGILSTVGPLALGAGAIYFLNKNREKLTGYKTQQAYEDARNQRRADNRLDYITDRMTSGKNYGNYEEALLDSGAGAVKIDDVIMSGADYFPEKSYKDAEPESIENIIRTDIPDRERGQDNVGPSPSKSSSSRSSRHSSGPGGLHSYYRGGIASL